MNEKDVFWLYVTMEESCLVHYRQSIDESQAHPYRLIQRNPTACLQSVCQSVRNVIVRRLRCVVRRIHDIEKTVMLNSSMMDGDKRWLILMDEHIVADTAQLLIPRVTAVHDLNSHASAYCVLRQIDNAAPTMPAGMNDSASSEEIVPFKRHSQFSSDSSLATISCSFLIVRERMT